MAKFAAEMEKVFEAVFSGSSIDSKTNTLVEADANAYAEADKILKGVIEKIAKEKWLVKESATDSLAHMAGMIKFQELSAGPSSVKTTKSAAPAAPVQAPAGVTESKKTALGFAKVFEQLSEFSGDPEPSVGDGQDVVDGDQDFTDAQTGNGDAGEMAGSDEELTPDGSQDPAMMGGEQDPAMGGDDMMAGQQDPAMGGDNPLDFDLDSFLGSEDPSGQADMGMGQPGADAGLGVDDGALDEPNDDDLMPAGNTGNAGGAMI